MERINLQESYLHNVVMTSINKLIREDINDNDTFQYFDDITNGYIDEVREDYEEKYLTCVTIVGKSGKIYIITCDANRVETSPYVSAKLGSKFEDYESPIPAEYDYSLEIKTVEYFDEDMNEYEDIASLVNIDELTQWLSDNLDWDELENNSTSNNVFDDFENEGEY